ncbi:transcription factor IIIA-like [Maniola hyperantus]|uniref:transcription factor IIIA-like n=1 Tax=Aphantopus hyperantus TaxID=2795564 RepID=UPI001569E09A|nr:transcription factor IIIA-like [Maniola hyperantus]
MEVIEAQLVEPNKKIYACPFEGCTSVFDRPYRLAQHRLAHVNVKPFVCEEPNCEKAYTSKSHLDRHIKTAHKEAAEVNVLYCCPKCMKKYVNRQNLKRHIKVSHIDNNKPFCCALCRIYFKKKHQLKAHMFIHNGLKPFRCPMCDRDFVTLYEKKKHMRNHKTYECEHCETKFTRWTELMHHKRVDHVSPEYICHDCGKVFKERGHIIRHVKKHMPNAPVNIFFCPYDNCLRHYSRNSNLKQHILVKHEGLTFDCSLCGAKLSTKAKLNEHVDRHNRPELPVKVPKTLETGRKKRKDAGTIRYETAMRLAGIVKQKIEEGITRLYSESMNYQENLQNCTNNASPCIENGDFRQQIKNHNDEESAVSLDDVNREPKEPNLSIEIKIEANSNESTELQNNVEHTSSKPPENFQHINESSTLSSRQNEGIGVQRKLNINQPTSLIEILNRPIIRIDRSAPASTSYQVSNNTIDIQVKIEADNSNERYDRDFEENKSESSNVTNESIKSEQAGTSNQQITEIPIKVEHKTKEHSNINKNDLQSNLQNGALNYLNMQSSATNNALSSLLQLYWKTILNHQDV